MEKFGDYSSRAEAADGPSGARIAYADYLHFYVVKDVNTRTIGLKAGDYDYAYMLAGDMFDPLSSTDGLVTTVNAGAMNGVVFTNNTAGILANNYPLRHALQVAISSANVLKAAVGAEALYNLCPEIYPDGFLYHSGLICEDYNAGDPVKAAEMAKAAGYNGETITFYINTNYLTYVNMCTVIIEQLRVAGFNIDAQYLERTTMMERRKDPNNWDLFFTHMSLNPLPLVYDVMTTSYAGWWTTPERNELFSQFVGTIDESARVQIWSNLQALIYVQLPIINIGHFFDYDAYSTNLQGLPERVNIYPYFWGVQKF
jgi:peptide/nickel transport system substrate-binding protein